MNSSSDLPYVTPESSWAQIQESNRILTERQLESERFLNEKIAEIAVEMKELQRLTGSWANNHGFFAEEYFFNSFKKGQQSFFGEKFDEMEKNVKGIKKGFKDEYDILLINGKSIGIIEIKYKAHENDVPKILKKAQTFRINFPEYKNHQIYLGLATLAFYSELEQACIDHGIAVCKQVGDIVVINDTYLQIF